MQTSKPSANAAKSGIMAAAMPVGGSMFAARRSMSPQDRERFFFFMAMMMKTGQTTPEALRAVAKSFKSEGNEDVSNALNTMAQKSAQGRPLSQAMLAERGMFTDIHRAAILAGEASNNMQKSFEILRVLEDKAINSSRAGMAELLTPLLMLFLSIVSLFNTGLNTLPVMAKLREAQGKPLGFMPQMIVSTTNFFADYWYVFGGILLTAIVMFVSFKSSPQGRLAMDKLKLNVPVYGKFLAYHTYGQMLMYFPYLIASGVKPKQLIPIMEALTGNQVLKKRIESFNHVITTGGSLSDAMSRAGFPELVVTPVSVAENYAPTEGNVNDVLIEGMQHAHGILERMLNDTHKTFISIASTILWVAGGAVMMMDMLSIVLSQA